MYRYSPQGPPPPCHGKVSPCRGPAGGWCGCVVVGLGRAPLTRDGFPEPVPIQSMYGISTYHKNNQMCVNISYMDAMGYKISYSFCIILQKILLNTGERGTVTWRLWWKVWIIWLYVTCLVLCKTPTYRAAGFKMPLQGTSGHSSRPLLLLTKYSFSYIYTPES